MGVASRRKQIKVAIEKWNCFGRFGYGQGRTVSMFGEECLRGKSACEDMCSRANACRAAHHRYMNDRYPQLAQLVVTTVKLSKLRELDPSHEVVSAMNNAAEMDLEEAVEIRERLKAFRISAMTDHFRCGQFENIQNGFEKVSPGYKRPIASDAKSAS